MKNLVFIALALFGTVSCASKKKMAKSEATEKIEVLSLTKTACFGECPVFTLKIFSNGLAVLDGQKFLKHIGLSEMMLTDDEMKALMKSCNDAQLFALKDDYTERFVMDLPNTTLIYHHDGKSKRISGNMKFPEGFKSVVKDCMDLLDDDRWVLKEAYSTK